MKARLKKELGQTGGVVSVFGEMFVAQERHRGLVGSAQAWMQGMPELSSEIWQQGRVAHCGLLAPDSPAAGQKSSVQLILQQIPKKPLTASGRRVAPLQTCPRARSWHTAPAPRGPSLLAHRRLLGAAERFLGIPGHGCSSLCCEGGIHGSPKAARSIPCAAACGRAGSRSSPALHGDLGMRGKAGEGWEGWRAKQALSRRGGGPASRSHGLPEALPRREGCSRV